MNILKKIFLLITLCALCTACGSNNEQPPNKSETAQIENNQKVDAVKPVAIIENYEETADAIKIQRANGTSSGAEALLYPNDEISGKVDALQIKCAPYADAKILNGAYKISYNPPSGIGEIANNVIDYASTFWNNVENVSSGASRASDDELNLNPKPGFNVTLLQNQAVTFAWDGAAKNFYINDAAGNKIFENAVAGKNFVEIIPAELKLNDAQKYYWRIDENSNAYQFNILDAQTEKEILSKLAEIDAENISPEERTLKKAAYVQLVSDIYPEKIDLYWLSAQWLSKISPADEKLKTNKSVLLQKCARHLDEEM